MRIGRYEVLSELARGGMGGVLLAHDPEGAVVVLKVQSSREDDVRLIDEGRIGARLSHPALVETKELLTHEGRPVLVLGYVPGVTLHLCRRYGALPLPVVVRVFRQVAEALHAIHTATNDFGAPLDIVHRDVTPANVIVGFDGDARLIDLGIARSSESLAEKTQAGMFRGTVRYIGPEILAGERQSQASDIWALGLGLFECVLGRRASGGTEAEILASIFQGRVLALQRGEVLPPELAPIIAGACAREAKQRLSAGVIAAMLRDVEARCGDTRTAVSHVVAEVARVGAADTTGTQSRLIAEAKATWGGQTDESGPIPRAPGAAPPSFGRSFADVAATLVDDEFASMPSTIPARPQAFSSQGSPASVTEETKRPLLADPWDLPPPITGEEAAPKAPLPVDFFSDEK